MPLSKPTTKLWLLARDPKSNYWVRKPEAALAKARAEMALDQPQPLGGPASDPADGKPAGDRAPETR